MEGTGKRAGRVKNKWDILIGLWGEGKYIYEDIHSTPTFAKIINSNEQWYVSIFNAGWLKTGNKDLVASKAKDLILRI